MEINENSPFIKKNQFHTAMLCIAKNYFVQDSQSCRDPAA